MKQFEVNFDGLVGPTHNYAGLSFGNVASLNNANAKSSPKQAAKQGLAKAKALAKATAKAVADALQAAGVAPTSKAAAAPTVVVPPMAPPAGAAVDASGFWGSTCKRSEL